MARRKSYTTFYFYDGAERTRSPPPSRTEMFMKGKYTALVISMISLIGILAILYRSANYGIGIRPDSVRFIIMTRNMLKGPFLMGFT